MQLTFLYLEGYLKESFQLIGLNKFLFLFHFLHVPMQNGLLLKIPLYEQSRLPINPDIRGSTLYREYVMKYVRFWENAKSVWDRRASEVFPRRERRVLERNEGMFKLRRERRAIGRRQTEEFRVDVTKRIEWERSGIRMKDNDCVREHRMSEKRVAV